MPRVVAMHDIDDVEHWLWSLKREEIFKGVMEDIVTFVHPTKPNRVGISATSPSWRPSMPFNLALGRGGHETRWRQTGHNRLHDRRLIVIN